ncbi:hypothetical protein G9A89_015312 [Geosiphon pyriformis]|nr:hypothetical protein G9A89_015312 [Geosiphon pyriformis]
MENKEIKRTLPESHDCNECLVCQNILNKKENWCVACQFIFFKKLYHDFSSGNKVVDEIIKNPIYIPPNDEDKLDIFTNGRILYYEWIPWNCLSNIKEIARGGFGIIYKATLIGGLINTWSIKHHGSMEYERETTNGFGKKIDEVAIKIIKTNSSEVFKELNIQRAMAIKSSLYNVSSILGITQNAETLEYGILMEFAEHGDMRRYLSTNFHSTRWKDKLVIAWRIAWGLSRIHSSGMVHRDLHSGNILQLSTYEANIGDLGLCQPTKNEATTTTTTTTTITEEKKIYGVIPYIPPEVLRREKFTSAGDIYSFSMLLWELATGKPPFHDRSHDHLLIMDILNGQRPKITSPLIPPSIAEIIEECWDANPENRPNAWKVWEKLDKLDNMYIEYLNKEAKNEVSIIEEPTGEESKTESYEIIQFKESDKYVAEMLKNDVIKNYSITMSTPIHPGAVYTSRVLSLQMIEETQEDS